MGGIIAVSLTLSLLTLEKVLDGSEEVRLISVRSNEILIINDVADKWRVTGTTMQ